VSLTILIWQPSVAIYWRRNVRVPTIGCFYLRTKVFHLHCCSIALTVAHNIRATFLLLNLYTSLPRGSQQHYVILYIVVWQIPICATAIIVPSISPTASRLLTYGVSVSQIQPSCAQCVFSKCITPIVQLCIPECHLLPTCYTLRTASTATPVLACLSCTSCSPLT
jgi:hypothetical protein